MKNWNFFVKAALLVFLLFGVITIIQLGTQISDLEDKVADADQQIEALNTDIEELWAELDQPVDEEYMKKIAREALNYHLPSEIVFYNDLAH